VQVDRLLFSEALGEFLALQHALHGDLAHQAHHVEEAELAEPVAVARHLQAVAVNDLFDLLEVVLRVRLHLLGRQAGAGLVPAAGVADQRGVVADDQHGLVTQLLKEAQLPQGDGVAEVHVDAGRVDAVLDAQRRAGLEAALQLPAQLVLRDDLFDAATDQGQLLGNGLHGCIPRSRFGLVKITSTSGAGPRRGRRWGNVQSPARAARGAS
jgi:hypothetical protein